MYEKGNLQKVIEADQQKLAKENSKFCILSTILVVMKFMKFLTFR